MGLVPQDLPPPIQVSHSIMEWTSPYAGELVALPKLECCSINQL
jgi:hypothetical protein